jgi:hypothetical protein
VLVVADLAAEGVDFVLDVGVGHTRIMVRQRRNSQLLSGQLRTGQRKSG